MTIQVLKRRSIEHDPISLCPRVSGEVVMQALKNGVVVRERVFPNLITNYGMDRLGDANQMWSHCHVGTGTTPPAFTDTTLAAYASGTSTGGSTSPAGVAPDYESVMTVVATFSIGALVGNFTEVGMSKQLASGALLSRALIVDGAGQPVAFPVSADEQLVVTYRFILYPPLVDVIVPVSISGSEYTATVRPLAIGSTIWGVIKSSYVQVSGNVDGSTTAYSGGMVPYTTVSPSGTLGSASSLSDLAYTAGTYYRDTNATWSPTTGVGSISTVRYTRRCGAFQVGYDRPIVKPAGYTLVLPSRLSWARR